jgi:translation initiation factor IF-1
MLGTVIATYGKFYDVKLEAYKSGKLISREHGGQIKISICTGDLVEVRLSPYDLSRGIIVLKS